jgi:hypothetical protein
MASQLPEERGVKRERKASGWHVSYLHDGAHLALIPATYFGLALGLSPLV